MRGYYARLVPHFESRLRYRSVFLPCWERRAQSDNAKRHEPVDLDYNLTIVRCNNFGDCKYLKESCRKAFNKA